jgi:hypothetical protein
MAMATGDGADSGVGYDPWLPATEEQWTVFGIPLRKPGLSRKPLALDRHLCSDITTFWVLKPDLIRKGSSHSKA